MRTSIRENALCTVAAAAACALMGWLGLYGFAWTDYDVEARPALDALVAGHLGGFLRLAPAYGGSLLERAPFALAPGLWGGGQLDVYRLVALPCLLASAVLGVVLLARMRPLGRTRLARGVALAVCVANPLTLRALELGHPEELLGGALCVLAVLAAGGERAILAGVLLGIAIANKEWAVLATGPVLLALPAGRRLRGLASAGGVAAAVLAPFLIVGSSGLVAGTRAAAAPPSAIFQPWQAWWFLGHHGAAVHGIFGALKPGYRTGPPWAGPVSHPLIVLLGAALSAALAFEFRGTLWPGGRRGPERASTRAALPESRALLLLALVLLLRCILDTWDTIYYPLPFLLALLAWEVGGRGTRPPVLALGSTVLLWVSFQWLPAHASPDAQAAFFLAWSLPLAAGLAIAVYRPGAPVRVRSRGSRRSERAQETTVSSLGRPVSTSGSPSRTTSRSSIRTPSSPGM